MRSIKIKLFLLTAILLFGGALNAQLRYLPQASQRATVTQRVGISDISIEYSRPKVNDRAIWGALIPYGLQANAFGSATQIPWRAGANENTLITFPSEVKIEGENLAAGTYSLHMILKENGDVTLIFNTAISSWGSYFYKQEEDVLRVDVTSLESSHHELLTYNFIATDATSTTAALLWEKRQVPFKIELPVAEIVISRITEDLRGSTGFSRQSWEQAAAYAQNVGELDQALIWIDASISGNFFSQRTYQNLSTKSNILIAQGNNEEAENLQNQAIALGNMNELNNLGYQLLGQNNNDKAIEVFQLNIKNNPNNANVYDSLGEAYKINGDNDKAITAFKKSLSLNPSANVKANSIKLLGELGVEVNN